MADAEEAADDHVTDAYLGGRLVLRQLRRGHRAGTDAVVLAAAAGSVPAGERFVDAGAGVGAVGLAVARRTTDARGTLIEKDPTVAALARENIEANGMSDRVSVCTADLFDNDALREAGLKGRAALALTNPPFFLAGQVRASPVAARADAHVLPEAAGPDGHATWLRQAIGLVRPRGRLILIHRADALQPLLRACEGRLGSLVLRVIQPRVDADAIRILLGGVVGGRAPLLVRPPLVLHEADGGFTSESAALHAGEDMRFWP